MGLGQTCHMLHAVSALFGEDEVQKHKGVMLQAAARPSYDAANDVYHMVEIKTEVIWG